MKQELGIKNDISGITLNIKIIGQSQITNYEQTTM